LGADHSPRTLPHNVSHVPIFTLLAFKILFSGLSATIGSPEVFSDWLATVQQAHGFDYDFIEHQHRYSHLRKSFYLVDGESVFKNLHQHTVTKRMKFLHPIGLLSFGPKNLPPDLSLEAADTLTLSTVLLSFRRQIDLDLSRADPAVFFASSHFLRQKDILDYETHLKTILTHLMKKWDPRDTSKPLGMVVEALQDPELKVLEGKTQLPVTRTAFLNDLLTLVADLHVKEQLVCKFSHPIEDPRAYIYYPACHSLFVRSISL